MRNYLFYSLLIATLSVNVYSTAQTASYRARRWTGACPVEGSATDEVHKELNRNKNQSAEVPTGNPKHWDITQVIDAPKHEDKDDFTVDSYVTLKGYLVSYKEEGGETCNCNQAIASQKTGDVHMYIGLTPDAPKSECVVVEITPDFKRLHPDYEAYLHNNIPITVSGYLLYDIEHRAQAINTCTHCANAWRKTCWEIHPIVSIQE